MKSEFLIVGVILVIVGLGIVSYGYKQIQPTKLEKVTETIVEWGETLSGEKAPPLPKRNKTTAALTMILGGIFFVIGLNMILKSGQREKGITLPVQRQDYYMIYCPNCGAQISSTDKFCPKCGAKTGGNND